MKIVNRDETIQRYVSMYDMRRFLNDELLRDLQLFTFPAYATVLLEHTEPPFLYFLVEGQVQCSHYHMNGKLAVIALSTPFCAIGDLEVLSEKRTCSNVIATQPTTMLGITRATVHRHGAHDPPFLRFLIDQLREKLYSNNSLQTNQVLPVASRLALYILAQPMKPDKNIAALPDKESLASLLGTTQRHLNRVIKELVASGGISAEYPTLRVLDRSILEEFVED